MVALEIDPALAYALHRRFQGIPTVRVLAADFLSFRISDPEYTLFGNIPFNRTAEIIRRILSSLPAPREACLIVQAEAAEKFCGVPRETRFSILAKPFFDLCVMRRLRRTDFEPMPSVDAVLMRMIRREPPRIPPQDAAPYRRFVCFGFGQWKPSLKSAFRQVFTYPQWKRLSRALGFRMDSTPTDLSFEQWLRLFDAYRRIVFLR